MDTDLLPGSRVTPALRPPTIPHPQRWTAPIPYGHPFCIAIPRTGTAQPRLHRGRHRVWPERHRGFLARQKSAAATHPLVGRGAHVIPLRAFADLDAVCGGRGAVCGSVDGHAARLKRRPGLRANAMIFIAYCALWISDRAIFRAYFRSITPAGAMP